MTRRKRRREPEPSKLAALKRKRDAEEMRQLGSALRKRMHALTVREPRPGPEEKTVDPDLVLDRPLARMPVYVADRVEPVQVEPLAMYHSLEDARMALSQARDRELLQELREHRTGRSNLTLGLAIGLSVVAVVGLGILVCYVLFRRRDSELGTTPVPMPYPYPVPQFGYPHGLQSTPQQVLRTLPPPAAADVLKQLKQERTVGTYMKSFTLPFIGDVRSKPVRIATAGSQPYEVVVRVVEPPGGQAVLSFEPNELNPGPLGTVSTLTTNFSQFPLGDVLVVPSGQFQVVRMRPHQALYGKGTVAANGSQGVSGVIVSVTGADFTVGL